MLKIFRFLFCAILLTIVIFSFSNGAQAGNQNQCNVTFPTFSCSTGYVCGSSPNLGCSTTVTCTAPYSVLNCATCPTSCSCDTTNNPCINCTAATSTAGQSCLGTSGCPTGGVFTSQCSAMGCPTGTENKNGVCVATAYMNFPNPGDFKITGTGAGDLYLVDGKAIRVDKSGAAAMLNIGNFLTTSGTVTDSLTNAVINVPTQPVSANIFGNLTIRNPANMTDKGKLTADQLCFGTNCKSSWDQVMTTTGNISAGGNLSVGGTISEGGKLLSEKYQAKGDYITVPTGSAQGDILIRDATGWTRLGAGINGQFLKTQGSGANPTWANVVAGLTGAGAVNTIAKFTGASILGNSLITDNGTSVSVNGKLTISKDGLEITVGNLDVKSGNLSVLGSVSASGCFGPVFQQKGTADDGSAGTGGYYQANAQCPLGMHVCTTAEILNSINCEILKTKMNIATNDEMWVSNGAPSLPTPTNDCLGWISPSPDWKGIKWVYNSVTGGAMYAESCNISHNFACCK